MASQGHVGREEMYHEDQQNWAGDFRDRCGVLGNPFHTNPGLLFPEKVLEAGSLPLMYI